jgi:hypothetical protein
VVTPLAIPAARGTSRAPGALGLRSKELFSGCVEKAPLAIEAVKRTTDPRHPLRSRVR